MEYEVYIIPDYRKAKDVLIRYPDSLCYINIDVDMHMEHWINFIESFKDDKALSTICMGIVSERLRKVDRDFLEVHCRLMAGLIKTTAAIGEVLRTFRTVFETLHAKGRRRYLRAPCGDDESAVISCNTGDRLVPLKIHNISSVGMICHTTRAFADKFRVHTVLRNSTLSLGRDQLLCSVIVYDVQHGDAESRVVLLFPKGVSQELRNTVRTYIFARHQDDIGSALERIAPDASDYTQQRPRQATV